MEFKVKGNRPNIKVLPSSCHSLQTIGLMAITQQYQLLCRSPINFYLMPFYSSHASDSDSAIKNHVTQNGCHVQALYATDFTTT